MVNQTKHEGILELAFQVFQAEGLVRNQQQFSTEFLGKTSSYYSSMTARRRQPPRQVLLRLLEQVFEIQLRFVNSNNRSKSSIQWAALEAALQDQLQQMEHDALAGAQDKSIQLPRIVDHPYTCKAALFRIAELMNQMGLCGNDEDFSLRYLGEPGDFLCKAADAQVVQLSERTRQNLRYMLRAHEKRLLARLDEPMDRDTLWVARARYNLMRFALDMFGSFVLAEQ
jgi:hypothetical protein